MDCPNCQAPIDSTTASLSGEVQCSQCGGQFSAESFVESDSGRTAARPRRPIEGIAAGYFVVGVLILSLLANVASIVVSYYADRSLEGKGVAVMQGVRDPRLQEIEKSMWYANGAYFALMFPMALLFLMWVHASYKNLRHFRCVGLQATPSWAVWSFVIPILNLFRPFYVMQEIWKASDPRADSTGWEQSPGSGLISWWWFAHLMHWGVSYLVAREVHKPDRTFEDLIWGLRAGMAVHALDALTTMLAIRMVLAVVHRQRQKSEGAG